MRLAALCALTAACAGPAATAPCPVTPAPVAHETEKAVLGETFTIDSKILGERRTINVYVPPDYGKATERYPVLYMPDGGMNEDFPHVAGSVDVSIKNAVIRPVIVVGVQNTERRRDLVGPTVVPDEQKVAPHAGGADKFRAFLRDELKPLIAQRYRTTTESALVGESLGGLFVVETMLVEPALFDAYIAADPSVWWNQQAVVRDSATRLAACAPTARTLYVASSEEVEIQTGVAALITQFQAHRACVTWTYEPMPAEHHSTIFPTAALHGIRKVFAAPPGV